MEYRDLKAMFQKKAEAGEGSFAVAFAILDLAEAQRVTASAIQRLGTGDASTHFGAIEALGMSVEKVAAAISESGAQVSEALSQGD